MQRHRHPVPQRDSHSREAVGCKWRASTTDGKPDNRLSLRCCHAVAVRLHVTI